MRSSYVVSSSVSPIHTSVAVVVINSAKGAPLRAKRS
jgi:hypothetical protein